MSSSSNPQALMRWLLYSALFSFSFAIAGEIELFCDWACDAKGQELFPLVDGVPLKDLSIHSGVRKKLREKGDEIRSWEIASYRPWLLKWKEVKSWQDFKYWLGLGLPRKEAPLPETKYWVFWSLGPKVRDFAFSRIAKEKLILMMWEPPTVQKEVYDPKIQACFGKIFTWDDDLVDGKKFFKFHYPVLLERLQEIPPFEEKKFCVMIARRLSSRHPKELYSQRERMIRFFEEKPSGEFDLYGYYWEKRRFKSWRGPLHMNKIEKLKEYKFSICYENTQNVRGYVTEKIFDCFAAGVVPVYWGASNVTDYIPKECFIDRREFPDEEAVYEFLKKISKEEYLVYLNAAEKFLLSEDAKPFSKEHFVENFTSHLQ